GPGVVAPGGTDPREARQQLEKWKAGRRQSEKEVRRLVNAHVTGHADAEARRSASLRDLVTTDIPQEQQSVAAANAKFETVRDKTRNATWSDPGAVATKQARRDNGVMRLTTDADRHARMLAPPSPYDATVGQRRDDILVVGSGKVRPPSQQP
ncbi:hypothetical protein T484DRAFT_1767937, partial [Baffinella frigidus]